MEPTTAYTTYVLFDLPDPMIWAQRHGKIIATRGPTDWKLTVEPSQDGPEGVWLQVTTPEGEVYTCPRTWAQMQDYADDPDADIEYVFGDGDAL